MHFVLRYFPSILLLGVAAEFFRIVTLSMGKFATSAATALFQPLLLLASLYVLGGRLHEESLALALLLSKLGALLVLLAAVLWKTEATLRPSFSQNPNTFRLLRVSVPYWSANIISNVASFYFDYVASGLGSGVLSSLAFAQRIFALPTVVILNPLMEIARTKLAEFQVAGDRRLFHRYYDNLIRISIYFSLPVAVIYFFFANNVISAMFQHGAFTANLADVSASILQIYAISMPFSCFFIVNGRACESYQRLLWPCVFGTLGNFLMMGLTLLLVRHWGYFGIPLSKLAVDVFYFLPFGFIAFKKFGGNPDFTLIGKALATAVIAALVPVGSMVYFDVPQNTLTQRTSLILLGQLILTALLGYAVLLMLIDRRIGNEVRRIFQRNRADSWP